MRVLGKPVGILEQAEAPRHVFTYAAGTPDTHFVSLTMPVRTESYVWEKGLHPFFQMNLPEGYRKDHLRERFGPVATVDDFSLLALTGASTLGRVTVHPLGEGKGAETPHGSVADILSHRNSREALLEYLAQTPLDAVPGVMPKALAADERITLKTPQWIIKTGRHDTPALCVNEYLCLTLGRAIGLPVPETRLSEDGEVLAVARFDINDAREPLGQEDLCSLLGLAPAEKYDTSAEQLVRTFVFISDAEKLAASNRFLDMMILNAAIRNADAHAKNYALLYSNRNDVTLAPAYDLISVHAYDAYAKNPYALSVGGTKSWILRKPLERFARERLSLNASRVADTVSRIAAAMTDLSPEIGRLAKAFPTFREPGKRIVRIWEEGIRSLEDRGKPIAVDLSAAKFSDEKRRPKKRSSRKSMNPERLD